MMKKRIINRFFEYEKTNDELFNFGELISLRKTLSKVVKGRIDNLEFIDFMEPDIDFKVNGTFVDLRLYISACNAQYRRCS